MKTFLIIALAIIGFALLFKEGCLQSDPYAEGMHWDYSISCEEGFLWKTRSNRGSIPLLHSDGTQVRCGEKRH